MSQKKALVTALIAGAGILGISSMACAEVPGFYVGAQAGYGYQYLDDPDVNQVLTFDLNPVSSTTSSNTKSGFAGGAYIGYQFNDYFGTELGYIHFPTASFNNTATGFNTFGNSTVNSLDLNSTENVIDLMLKAQVPFGGGFGGYAKIGGGYVYNKFDATFNSTSTNATNTYFNTVESSGSNNQFKPIGAIGLTYDIYDYFVVDLSYTYLFGSSGTTSSTVPVGTSAINIENIATGVPRASMIALGATYYFGGSSDTTDDP